MYTPSLRVKNNGVPILSKAEIDAIGERFVQDFQPEVLTNLSPVDIEGFIEFYLGMTPDYQYLSHNGVYLGMTVFNDTNKVPVFDPATNRAEYISAKARTVIIDNRLLDESQRHRYRFTLGHEGGHDIFHSGYFSYNPDQVSIFDDELIHKDRAVRMTVPVGDSFTVTLRDTETVMTRISTRAFHAKSPLRAA